jgi:hypothetical protein
MGVGLGVFEPMKMPYSTWLGLFVLAKNQAQARILNILYPFKRNQAALADRHQTISNQTEPRSGKSP